MGDEELLTKVPKGVANGISEPVKSGGEVTEKKDDDNKMTAMEEDKSDKDKTEYEKMSDDPKEEEDKEKTEENVKEEENAAEDEKEKEEHKTKTSEETNGPQEDEKIEEKEESKEAVEEKANGLKETGDEGEKEEEEAVEEIGKREEKELKGLKKRMRGKTGEKKSGRETIEKKKKVMQEKEPEPRTPAIDRPQRERKSVERLVASIDRDASKEFQIEKGRGTPLKDIPNVALKLSRRKTDDTFKLLHTILFGRRGKAILVKSNILRFSGFVWHKNEEKHMIKVKEKFDKCNKEKLLEFCDVFDIPIAKASTKKEDIIAKLVDFLMAPHATTTDLHAEKEKGSKSNKRKRVDKSSTSGSASSKRSTKSQKRVETASKKSRPDSEDETEEEKEEEEEEKEENVEEENENGLPEKSEPEMPEPSESEEKVESEEESEDDTKKHRSTKSSSGKKGSAGKTKTKKATVSIKTRSPPKRTPKRSSAKRTEVDDDSDAAPKASSKNKKNEPATKKSSLPAKSSAKEKTGKKAVKAKEKVLVKGKSKPTDDELRDATCEILKEVDFNTATFTDILKQLAKRFDVDLTPRKSSIKLMIQEELTKLADEADEEDGEADADKNDNQAAGKEVEA